MNRVVLLLAVVCAAVTYCEGYSAVDATTYANLVRYVKFAGKAYTSFSCTGYTRVATINISSTDTQGYIARDDSRKQLVVVFRGSVSQRNYQTDYNGTQIAYTTGGCTPSCKVHGGFAEAWNSAASLVISTLTSQLASYPGYTIYVTGHSLGGALAALGGPGIKAAGFSNVTVYSYGAPRVLNAAGANWLDTNFPASKVFRGTHTNDSVPGGAPVSYARHFGIEYWQSPDPSSQANTHLCVGQEDTTCNGGTTASSSNSAHTTYFGFSVGAGGCP